MEVTLLPMVISLILVPLKALSPIPTLVKGRVTSSKLVTAAEAKVALSALAGISAFATAALDKSNACSEEKLSLIFSNCACFNLMELLVTILNLEQFAGLKPCAVNKLVMDSALAPLLAATFFK